MITGDERLMPCPNPVCDRWVDKPGAFCCCHCIPSRHPDYEFPYVDDATPTCHSTYCEEWFAERGPIPAAMQARR